MNAFSVRLNGTCDNAHAHRLRWYPAPEPQFFFLAARAFCAPAQRCALSHSCVAQSVRGRYASFTPFQTLTRSVGHGSALGRSRVQGRAKLAAQGFGSKTGRFRLFDRGWGRQALRQTSDQRYSMEQECPSCSWRGVQLAGHFRESARCAPAKEAPPEKRARESAGREPRDPARAAQLFFNRVHGEIGKWFLHGHIDHFLSLTELDNMRGLLRICASLTTEFIEEELELSGHTAADPKIFECARRAFEVLPNVNTLISQRQRSIARAVPRHLGNSGEDTKGAAFFDVHALLTIMLQESAAARKAVITASEEWKTGALYKTRPNVLSDLVHGTRFLDWQAVCGKADESEAKDLRVVLHIWTDEFTPIDGLSQKARHHKYGAVLAALVNLPHRMRHYADHILLLALYNSRYAKHGPNPSPSPPPLWPYSLRRLDAAESVSPKRTLGYCQLSYLSSAP